MGKTSTRSDDKTRADRKFEKKVQFYQFVRNTVAQKTITNVLFFHGSTGYTYVVYGDILMEKQKRARSHRKKLKAYDLSSLAQYLPELKDPSIPRPLEFKLNSKTRNKLLLKEGNQLKTVINHPVFQSDPLAAIYQHLQNTQPRLDDKKAKRNDIKDWKLKSKRKKRKAPGQQAMEI